MTEGSPRTAWGGRWSRYPLHRGSHVTPESSYWWIHITDRKGGERYTNILNHPTKPITAHRLFKVWIKTFLAPDLCSPGGPKISYTVSNRILLSVSNRRCPLIVSIQYPLFLPPSLVRLFSYMYNTSCRYATLAFWCLPWLLNSWHDMLTQRPPASCVVPLTPRRQVNYDNQPNQPVSQDNYLSLFTEFRTPGWWIADLGGLIVAPF